MDKCLLGLLGAALLVLGVAMPIAQADDEDDDGYWPFFDNAKTGETKPGNSKWVAECGACHLAFPARFLSAESWREMMSGLDKHFGSDASLDAETVREITAFLEQNARSKKTGRDASGKEPLRITESRWFRREHAEAESRVTNNQKVKSMANCPVCHTKAEVGDYNERHIKIPK